MPFIYKPMGAVLTPSQESLLETIENAGSPFTGITNLKELRKMTGLNVIVADRGFLTKLLDDIISSVEKFIEDYRGDFKNFHEVNRQIERDIYDKLRWAEDEREKVANPQQIALLGLYSRKCLWFDGNTPTVYLFADNINAYARSLMAGTSVDNIFGYVFIHEMMHAYYDSLNNAGFPSWKDLEEAFAEFGMLTFLNRAGLPSSILHDAIYHVKFKIKHGPREYGYGYELYTRTGGGNPGMIERYREISNWIDADIISSWAGRYRYFNDIWLYKRTPDNTIADDCYEGVKEILDYDWKKPKLIIQPSIHVPHRLSPVTAKIAAGSTSHLPAMADSNQRWALTSYQDSDNLQLYLIHSDNLKQLYTEIVKAIKAVKGESHLIIVGDSIVFCSRKLFGYNLLSASSCPGPLDIHEKLCIDGTTVYPHLKGGETPDYMELTDMLYFLSVLFNGTFTLAYEAPGYTLYGSSSCMPLFSEKTESVTAPSSTHSRFAFDCAVPYFTNGKERIYFNIPAKQYHKWQADFMKDYNLPNPTEIRLTFESKKCQRCTVKAMVYGQKPKHPERPRIGIDSKDDLSAFKKIIGTDTKRFSFYEKTPTDGINPAEWVAQEI